MNVFCPKCGTELNVEPNIAGMAPCPSCGEMIDCDVLHSAVCPICGCGFEESDTMRVCPNCKTPHHEECWADNRGCSTYGCASAAHKETHTPQGATPNGGDDPGMVACPACGAMHPATDLVCAACGKLLGDNLPGDSASDRLKEKVGQIGATVKSELWPRIARNLTLLGRDISVIFRLWWGEFSQYARFSGKTARHGYVAFCSVSIAGIWLLAYCGAEQLAFIVFLAVLLPTLASTVRRLRDTDIPPWLIIVATILTLLLIPLEPPILLGLCPLLMLLLLLLVPTVDDSSSEGINNNSKDYL